MAYRGIFFLHSLVVLASELSDGNPLLSPAPELGVGSVSMRVSDSAPPHTVGVIREPVSVLEAAVPLLLGLKGHVRACAHPTHTELDVIIIRR